MRGETEARGVNWLLPVIRRWEGEALSRADCRVHAVAVDGGEQSGGHGGWALCVLPPAGCGEGAAARAWAEQLPLGGCGRWLQGWGPKALLLRFHSLKVHRDAEVLPSCSFSKNRAGIFLEREGLRPQQGSALDPPLPPPERHVAGTWSRYKYVCLAAISICFHRWDLWGRQERKHYLLSTG